jgi:hypothetical protein
MSAEVVATSSQLEQQQQQQHQETSPVNKAAGLTRISTQPANMGSSPRQAVLHRQLSAQTSPATTASTTATPVSSLTAYLKYLLGLSAKPTKRTLSEEAECGAPESISEWLRQGSDANEVDAYGYTPLVNACLRYLQFFFFQSIKHRQIYLNMKHNLIL